MSSSKAKIESIFKKYRIACDNMVVCELNDWNSIVSYINELESSIVEVQELMDESVGVSGYHLNGDVTEWGELDLSAATVLNLTHDEIKELENE